jgi:hypothetical protein
MNRCRAPIRFFYGGFDRLERKVLIPDGGLGFCSSQPIVQARQIGASMTFPLFIDSSMMRRVCEESRAGRQVELIQRNGVVDHTLQNLLSAMVADLKAGLPRRQNLWRIARYRDRRVRRRQLFGYLRAIYGVPQWLIKTTTG